jgi:hypothetical protein
MSRELRQMIRSILIEELAKNGVKLPADSKPEVREEVVVIQSDRDLARFVSRLLDIAKNSRARADVESGRHVFRLEHRSATSPSTPSHRELHRDLPPRASSQSATFDNGLVTEKQIHNLPDDVAVVKIGSRVRLTPLAGDAIRQAGIKIQRVKT